MIELITNCYVLNIIIPTTNLVRSSNNYKAILTLLMLFCNLYAQ